jgi:hypothetical protein
VSAVDERPRIYRGRTLVHVEASLDSAITWAQGGTTGRPNTLLEVIHEREGFPTYLARVRNGVSELREVKR